MQAVPTIATDGVQSSGRGLAPVSTAIGYAAEESVTGKAFAESGLLETGPAGRRATGPEAGYEKRAAFSTLPRPTPAKGEP